MKIFKQIILILIVFFKTGNLLSENNLFNVNNIDLERKGNISSNQLANQAIQKGFNQLIKRVLMKEDLPKVSGISFLDIKNLVTYYNISENTNEENSKINFSVTFDKDKIHDLFYKKGISYSDITDKDFYILPILLNNDEVYIFSNNYFYENWNKLSEQDDLIEFILPIENIEIIQKINNSRNNLLDLDINSLFKEYLKKNIAIILIENNNSNKEKIYLKAKIQGKIISKSFVLKKDKFEKKNFNEKIIYDVKDEITNLVKSQNLIDIRTPSFLNVKLNLNKGMNLVLLNSRIQNIDLIENIFVQEFNRDYVNLRIKYLGKLDKIINLLKIEKIELSYVNDQWFIHSL
tara:strand:+ start:26244 stop:27287 length:1044 start_codon:yes stop_codon:yes gene_type:complete